MWRFKYFMKLCLLIELDVIIVQSSKALVLRSFIIKLFCFDFRNEEPLKPVRLHPAKMFLNTYI